MHNVLNAHTNEYCSLVIQLKHIIQKQIVKKKQNYSKYRFYLSFHYYCHWFPLSKHFFIYYRTVHQSERFNFSIKYQVNKILLLERIQLKKINWFSGESTKMILHLPIAYIKIPFLFCIIIFTYFRYTFGQSSQNINVCK